ncbi:prepilin-type N-terminal cleavage/methylation domain-containing protein [Thiomicrorhabdus immobilis]|uniref:Prepilin-type N-terminal cleavage/methylation domain-containing protein n=1 Tax=Thiomicrorhabdus immobilis TaxID=2791037 RepID=A0ABM7MFL4_9GAMM|nr:type II secretion system protein [Thiomicrorhabdus immobilis]BCN94303.1 prepilin-type N-terminal cleavage/methylation domain-containing protein [Thiomicrorhabdus immobilis]
MFMQSKSMDKLGVATQTGYSLIELSVAVMIIGFVVTIIAELYPKISDSSAKQVSLNQSERLEQTILGFVFATGRLPCPASNMTGVENCTLEKGELPYRTLGLATPIRNQAGIALRYAVFDKSLTGSSDIALTELKDRYEAFIATDDNSVNIRPVAQKTILNVGNPNGLDMCHALLNGTKTSNDTTKLHTGTGANFKHVAYLIHDLGLQDADNLNGLFDGSNTVTATDLQFNQPTDIASLNNDDRVYVKSFSQLWDDLGCVSVTSAVGHGHPNVATASAIMNQALADYKVQAELAADVASADIAAAAAAILSGASGTAAAAATIPIATSESINTAGAAAPTAALSVAAVAAAAASVVTASIVTGMAAANKIGADDLVNQVSAKLTEINTLNASIYSNAVQADAKGVYQQ